MKARIYIETSVISYLCARPSRDLIVAANQEITREWWERDRGRYDCYVSALVLDEASSGDEHASAKRRAIIASLMELKMDAATVEVARELLRWTGRRNAMKMDPIVAELHKIREERARRFNYDLDAMFEDLYRKQARRKNMAALKPVKPALPCVAEPHASYGTKGTANSSKIAREQQGPHHRHRRPDAGEGFRVRGA